MSTLGERLRELRVSDPYSRQRDAAHAAGIHHVRLSKIEADREKPTKEELAALALTYNASVVELWPLWHGWRQAPPPDLSASICSGRGSNLTTEQSGPPAQPNAASTEEVNRA